MKKLNYKKMVEDINRIVSTDFLFNMECKELPHATSYTQEDAGEMSDILGQVYSIAHCIRCESCQREYLIK